MESQNISLNRPVSPKSYSPAPQTDIRQDQEASTEPDEKMRTRPNQASIELYGGTGKVRTEQPSVRGTKIDITI